MLAKRSAIIIACRSFSMTHGPGNYKKRMAGSQPQLPNRNHVIHCP